jgi:hypothetical protein
MRKHLLLTSGLCASAFLFAGLGVAPAMAGTVIMEGSDAIDFHCGGGSTGGACEYKNQVWSAIGGADPRPILVVGSTFLTSQSHPIVDFTNLDSSGVGALSNYVAIYMATPCCNSSPGDMGSRLSDVEAYLAAGGTVEIENYDGNPGWNPIVGVKAGDTNVAHIAGITFGGGGLPGGPGCSDGEKVTAVGLTNGFTQPPAISCWTHQAYDQSYFAALGFTESFFDSDPLFAADNPGDGPFSSLLSNGSTVSAPPSGVPELSTWVMMLVGFAGLGYAGTRKARNARVVPFAA